MRSTRLVFSAALVLAVLGTVPARADIAGDCAQWRKTHGPGDALPTVCLAEKDKNPPLISDIGKTQRDIRIGDTDIQNFFNQGLRFLYARNARESYRAFRYAVELATSRKKDCGYCYWGVAASLSVAPGAFLPPEPDRQAARAALNKALAIFDPDKKQAWGLVNALAVRMEDCKSGDKCAEKRATDYYNTVVPLQSTNTYDAEINSLYGDAAMGIPRADRLDRAREAFELAMKTPFNADHTGLWFWYLHIMEALGRSRDALAAADKLGGMAPGAGYLVHLPSRTYFQFDMLAKSLAANKKATDVDQKYFNDPGNPLQHPAGDVYRYDTYLHEIHFLIASVLPDGNKEATDIFASHLLAALPREPDAYRHDFYRTMYTLGRLPLATVDQVRGFPKPDAKKQPLDNVAYYYAQVRADLWNGQTESPNLKLLDGAVSAYPDKKKCPDEYQAFYTEPCLVDMISYMAHGYASAAAKSWKDALTSSQKASEIRKRIRDGLPGVWYLPVEQTVASFYIQAALGEHQPQQDYLSKAQALLKKSLDARPANGWAYFGLWQVAKYIKNGNPGDAEKAFRAHWVGEAPKLDRL